MSKFTTVVNNTAEQVLENKKFYTDEFHQKFTDAFKSNNGNNLFAAATGYLAGTIVGGLTTEGVHSRSAQAGAIALVELGYKIRETEELEKLGTAPTESTADVEDPDNKPCIFCGEVHA